MDFRKNDFLILASKIKTKNMTLEIALRYIHFISIFTIVGCLVSEHLLLKKEMTPRELDRIARIDLIYGIAAITLLIAGLTLWFGSIGKPSIVYTKNWIFHIKLTLFVTVGLLSIYPTVFFLKNRGDQEKVIILPKSIFWLLRIEILLLFIIPLLAGLMSRGVGYFG
jgi:putative membrane protein